MGTPGHQGDLNLLGGAEGSYFAAWSDERGATGDEFDLHIFGAKLSNDGTPTPAGGRLLASSDHFNPQPGLSTGPNGTAFLTWRQNGPTEGRHRRAHPEVDLSRDPHGPHIRRCSSAGAAVVRRRGGRQRAVPGHVAGVPGLGRREHLRPALLGGRHPHGTGAHAVIGARQTSPARPPRGTDRDGWSCGSTAAPAGKDIYGTFVSGTGAVSPAAGIPISTAAGPPAGARRRMGRGAVRRRLERRSQREPGHLRHTAHARRVGARSEPACAVTTAAGIQRRPTIASLNGSTLIAWVGDDVQRRILRTERHVPRRRPNVGPSYAGSYGDVSAAAASSRFAVLYEDSTMSRRRLLAPRPPGRGRTRQPACRSASGRCATITDGMGWARRGARPRRRPLRDRRRGLLHRRSRLERLRLHADRQPGPVACGARTGSSRRWRSHRCPTAPRSSSARAAWRRRSPPPRWTMPRRRRSAAGRRQGCSPSSSSPRAASRRDLPGSGRSAGRRPPVTSRRRRHQDLLVAGEGIQPRGDLVARGVDPPDGPVRGLGAGRNPRSRSIATRTPVPWR